MNTSAKALTRPAHLLVGLWLSFNLALAEENPSELQPGHWATDTDDLQLSFSRDKDQHVVCPRLRELTHQPFCREFAADLLSVCGHRNALQLVLENGEVHRVDGALIGTDGGFEPAFAPSVKLELIKAWAPNEQCDPNLGLADVIGVSTEGALWHFDGSSWNRISANLNSRTSRLR